MNDRWQPDLTLVYHIIPSQWRNIIVQKNKQHPLVFFFSKISICQHRGWGSPKNRDQKQIKLGIKNIFSHKAARNAASFVAKTNNSRFLSPWVTKAVLTQNLKELVGVGGGGRCALPNAEPVAAKDAALPSSFLPCLHPGTCCVRYYCLPIKHLCSLLPFRPCLLPSSLPPFLPCLPSFLPSLPSSLASFPFFPSL